jgi:hypothetical protein
MVVVFAFVMFVATATTETLAKGFTSERAVMRVDVIPPTSPMTAAPVVPSPRERLMARPPAFGDLGAVGVGVAAL